MEENIRSLENKLNNVIDDELKKDTNDIDTNLITECCDGLLRMDDISKYLITEKEAKKNIRQILNHGKEKRKLKKPVKVLLVAAIIAVLLAIAALGYAQVKYDILHFSDHSTVFWNNVRNKKVDEINIEYVPNGFDLINEEKYKYSMTLNYQNGDDFFDVIKNSAEQSIDVNTEFNEAQTVSMNGIDYIIYGEPEHGEGVVWQDNNFQYLINGNISKDELLKIALSVS